MSFFKGEAHFSFTEGQHKVKGKFGHSQGQLHMESQVYPSGQRLLPGYGTWHGRRCFLKGFPDTWK